MAMLNNQRLYNYLYIYIHMSVIHFHGAVSSILTVAFWAPQW